MKHVCSRCAVRTARRSRSIGALGFFAMGVRARYYPDDEDAVEMVLMLDPDTGDIVAHDDEVRLDTASTIPNREASRACAPVAGRGSRRRWE